jgi:hypothetical protein
MPLSWYGLCDALITHAASASSFRVRKATPGVVMTPADRHLPPRASRLDQRLLEPVADSRVSLPMMIAVAVFLRDVARARNRSR